MSAFYFVTSMNKTIFEKYGKRFIDEFLRYKSDDIALVIVFEGDLPDYDRSAKGVEFLKLSRSRHPEFLSYFGHLYEANGVKIRQQKKPNGEVTTKLERDFKFDAKRFSFKIFSLMLARKHIKSDSAFAWIDADMRVLKSFSIADIEPLMPRKNELMSYLGRTSFPPDAPYSECGFLGFNPHHPKTDSYLERMQALYLTGEFFTKKQWHDSWLWDEVRQEFEKAKVKFRNISGKAENLEHPFINTALGKFFDHLKGPSRKQKGKSFDTDYKNKPAQQHFLRT